VPTFVFVDGSGAETRRLAGEQTLEALAGPLVDATGVPCAL
jgi:hypothetical protein